MRNRERGVLLKGAPFSIHLSLAPAKGVPVFMAAPNPGQPVSGAVAPLCFHNTSDMEELTGARLGRVSGLPFPHTRARADMWRMEALPVPQIHALLRPHHGLPTYLLPHSRRDSGARRKWGAIKGSPGEGWVPLPTWDAFCYRLRGVWA